MTPETKRRAVEAAIAAMLATNGSQEEWVGRGLDAALAVIEADAWQPIETCPRMEVVIMFAVTDIDDLGVVNNWQMETGYIHADGCIVWDGHALQSYNRRPTHWRPLPPLPPPPTVTPDTPDPPLSPRDQRIGSRGTDRSKWEKW